MLKGKNITFIESEFEEDIILEVEALIEANALNGKFNPTSKKWELTVQDKPYHFHTELFLRGDRIDDYTCNCMTFLQEDFCSHVAASIIHVRKYKSATGDEVTKTKKRESSRSFKSFLSGIGSDQLKEFVRDHARSDYWFKLRIQARFYDKKSRDEKDQFIESLFPVVTQRQISAPARKIAVFIKITGELMDQLKSYVQQNDLIEAYKLIFQLLKKSFYIKYNHAPSHEKFIDNHEMLLKNFLEILSMIEAPEFRLSAASELLNLLSSSYITLHSKMEKELWIRVYKSIDDRQKLLQVNQQFLSPPVKDFTTYYFMLSIEILLLESNFRDEAIRKLSNQEVYRVVHILIDFLDLPESVLTLNRIFMIYPLNYPLASQVLKHMNGSQLDQDEIDRVLYYFDLFKNRFFVQWLADETKLSFAEFVDLTNIDVTGSNMTSYLEVLCSFRQYEKAADLIEKTDHLEILKKFDRELAAYLPERVEQIYLQFIKNHLSNHFGVQARQFVKNLIGHLRDVLDPEQCRRLDTEIMHFISARKAGARKRR
ncbi:MAG: hypothetical protein HKN92_01585 [Chitinophagales bacterium]|nr:hypothetical protein [Chitinophagales bacterium]